MAQLVNVRLNKGDAGSLGFRLQGGKDFGTPLLVQKVNIGSPAEKAGLVAGDAVIKVNATDVYNLRHKDAQDVIIRAGPSFELTIQRGGATWKPTVTPLPKSAVSNSYAPVTKTSLAAKPQSSIGAIGTGHNLSAKPFSPQLNGAVNGGPRLVNKQYNTPLGLYSEQSIAETLSAQAEVLSTGVLGVNFKKNEKDYDASNSEVFRMVQEADKEPRDAEAEPDSGVVSVPFNVGGLKHVQAPESKPAPPTPQLPPGQNICAECERLIVGVFVRIKDKNLHVECFKCSTCGASLKNVGYYNINQKLYCDIHAKLAARSNPPAPNLVPVTVPPGGKAPAGTISAALATRPLPSAAAPLSPLSTGSNLTAQPFQAGTNFSSPRPFSSVSGPLSPAANTYATLPKTSPAPAPAPAPFASPVSAPSSEKGRSLPNIIWPPPPVVDEPELPTASPLYFPPSTHIRVPTPPFHPPPPKPVTQQPISKSTEYPCRKKVIDYREEYSEDSLSFTSKSEKAESIETEEAPSFHPPPLKHITQQPISKSTEYPCLEKAESIEAEEFHNIAQNMDAKMSLCSSEVTSITQRQVAVEKIETAAETQMFVESLLQQRPNSPPPTDKDLQPKVEVITQPLSETIPDRAKSAAVKASPNEPRVITRVCVCTNSCCNANTGELCESCPMRDLKRPKDYHKPKLRPVENAVPKRYGSPIITGVSVTVNNPSRIREAVKDLFTEIPGKKTTSALGSALAIAPKEPFSPASKTYSVEPVPLPEETKPYLPPERPVTQEPKPKPPPVEKPPQPDTPFISALRIAPERPFTPVDKPTPVKKKKAKEDPLLKDLPKPVQWMSMVTALTTAPDRAYSPFVQESATMKQTVETEVHAEEITKMKETQQEILKRSVHNETALPKPFVKPVKLEKFEPVNDDKITPQMHFPPISEELKAKYEYHADYSEVKSEISSQIIEQAHLEEQTISKKEYDKEQSKSCKFQQEKQEEVCVKKSVSECHRDCSKTKEKTEENVIAKQTEETIVKKPLELTGYLHKPEYLPQYQVSLNYDETIQLPHHKDIKKLLPTDQNTQHSQRGISQSVSSTQGHLKQTASSQYSAATSSSQSAVVMKPVTTIRPGETNPNVPQVVFQPVSEDRPPRTTFSPRPGSLTPSMINKPAPSLPYYQANLVASQLPPPEINVFDPKSPATSRSPSPCPDRRERSPSPFGRKSPRPVSPAAGPPPNPLKMGQAVPKFTREDRIRDEAKKYISGYIPQYREKVDGVEIVQSSQAEIPVSTVSKEMKSMSITVPSISKYVQSSNAQTCNFSVQESRSESQTVVTTATQQQSSTLKKCEEQSISSQGQSISSQGQSISSQGQSISSQRNVQCSKAESSATMECQRSVTTSEKQSYHRSSEYPFQKVKNPEIIEQGVQGMHITNPQPIVSPFIRQEKTQAPPEPSKSVPPPPPPRKQIIPVQVPSQNKNVPSVSASVSTTSQPNAGIGGGRQAGAIGVAPKRGRGVLNVGGLIGSRIPLCGHCHGHIRGPFVTALGKIWCPEHFTCNTPSCRRPLHDLGFVEEQGQLYCEYCFEQYLAPPCSKCGAKVKGDCLKAIGKNFHPECFNCSYCGKLFGNTPFFLEDGQPYCENDWNELFTTKCFACGFPVEAGDRWVEALNNNYHSQCFNCTMCKKNLEGQSFFAKGGRPFCKNHAR